MKYRKKPKIVEAIQWTGDNYDEVCEFAGEKLTRDGHELFNGEPACLVIETPVWELATTVEELALIGDYICKVKDGRCYKSKRDEFEEEWEKIEEDK